MLVLVLPKPHGSKKKTRFTFDPSQARQKTPMHAPFESEARKQGKTLLANQWDTDETERKRGYRVEAPVKLE